MRPLQNSSIIAVDVGNTSIGIGCFCHPSQEYVPRPKWSITVLPDCESSLEKLRSEIDSDATWYIASVSRPALDWLLNGIRTTWPNSNAILLAQPDLPIEVELPNPKLVGLDRLAAAAAANRLRKPNQSAIIVDAGSAITVDAISRDGKFLGGAIMAGLAMKTKALAAGTDLLPEIQLRTDLEPAAIGKSTSDAIRGGCYWGTVGSIREVRNQIERRIGKSETFLTGGDMEHLGRHLGDVTYVKDLVLSGIRMSAAKLATDEA